MWNENIRILRQEGWPAGVPTLLVIGPLTIATLDDFMQAVRMGGRVLSRFTMALPR